MRFQTKGKLALIATALMMTSSFNWPNVGGVFTPAVAQRLSVSAEFRAALQPYGRWEHRSRWGDVWIPAGRPRDWRPYTVGRWAYTDDWGWYWISDDEEQSWGWIVFHYGRWVLDPDFGWIWVPGDDWGPGWVQWRRGEQYIGWCPLPPDEQIEVAYRDEPDVWVFVRSRDFIASQIASVILPSREYRAFVRDTVVENRTVDFRDSHFGVNPGIAPSVIAAAVGHPVRSFDVRPHVLAGTARVNGAIEVRGEELGRLRGNRDAFRDSVRESQREFRPVGRVPPPQALGVNERGRLGENPPRAAQRGGTPAGVSPQREGGEVQPGLQGRGANRQQLQRQGNVDRQPNVQQRSEPRGVGEPSNRETLGAGQPRGARPPAPPTQRQANPLPQQRAPLQEGRRPAPEATQGLSREQRRQGPGPQPQLTQPPQPTTQRQMRPPPQARAPQPPPQARAPQSPPQARAPQPPPQARAPQPPPQARAPQPPPQVRAPQPPPQARAPQPPPQARAPQPPPQARAPQPPPQARAPQPQAAPRTEGRGAGGTPGPGGRRPNG